MPPTLKDERDDDGEYYPDATVEEKPSRARKAKQEGNGTNNLVGTEHIEVKTKFPVARIKRIMQADDDVGKVAQVTPVVVSKALELFMISLVTKAAVEAKARSSKRVTSAHLKQAVTNDEQFDFLTDIVSKVADAPAAAEKSEDTVMEGEGKKRKGGARKKRKADDDDF
ncbi:histone-fold-containing protein [Lophium mytilinum]|uniref:NCT transcriptional regulatory complex subunit A n=1 Tax=Lophium mytilinum TaxID=390894 RepID=A0A6A6R031_9PEZI|nr:histone-fold-containing protein [Lophium mytilinum]